MKTTAAVLVETGKPLVLEELEIPALRPGQVLVEIKYSGVCRTQLSECRGYRGKDPYLPHCLGHEGSGIVLEVGANVTKVKPGDRVLLSWMKGTGAEVGSTAYQSGRGQINAGAITTFMRHSVVSENRVSVLPEEIEFRQATIFGCAVPTGIGAVVNTAQAKAGQSAIVFGAGGIGLHPAIAAPAIAHRPMPPAPNTMALVCARLPVRRLRGAVRLSRSISSERSWMSQRQWVLRIVLRRMAET